MRRKILVVCNDDVIGAKMAGPAIRCVEIARRLASEHAVVLAAPNVSLQVATPFGLLSSPPSAFVRQRARLILLSCREMLCVLILSPRLARRFWWPVLYCPIPLEYHQVSDGVDMETRTLTGAYLADVRAVGLCRSLHLLPARDSATIGWVL